MTFELGTIWPTKRELQIDAERCDRAARQRDAIIRRTLSHCTRKVVGGEVRYYDTTDQYAIMTRRGEIIWFAVREDGDHRI